jgi:hypothetical protein
MSSCCGSEHRSESLRRLAANEQVNDQVDWANIIDEGESVGSEQLHEPVDVAAGFSYTC